AVDLARIEPGATAGVHGCGPLGLLVLQLLRRRGVEVVATDPLPHRAEAAEALGAGRSLATSRADGRELLPSGAAGADVTFDVSGDDDALATAIDVVRPGGTVVVVGIPSHDRSAFVASTARRKELTLVLCRRMRGEDLPRAVEVAALRQVELASLVTERFPLQDGATAFEALADRRGLKVIVEPQQQAA